MSVSLILSLSLAVCVCVCDPGRPAAPVRNVSTVVACLISTQGIWWHEARSIGGKKECGVQLGFVGMYRTQRRIKWGGEEGGGRGGEVRACWCGSGVVAYVAWYYSTTFSFDSKNDLECLCLNAELTPNRPLNLLLVWILDRFCPPLM